MKQPVKPDHISQEDWDSVDVPDLSETAAPLRPFADVFPEAAAGLKAKGGRPKLAVPTAKTGWRWPVDLLQQLRATGKGYPDRIEALVREALAQGRL